MTAKRAKKTAAEPAAAPAKKPIPASARRRRPVTPADPQTTVTPEHEVAAALLAAPPAAGAALDGQELDATILRFIRRFPNETVDLSPLAEELGVDPDRVQLAVESLHRRGMVVAPFIEPGPAGGATLTQIGLRWLIEREGGRPKDKPEALKPAKKHVRPQDEAARLPRADVYGVARR